MCAGPASSARVDGLHRAGWIVKDPQTVIPNGYVLVESGKIRGFECGREHHIKQRRQTASNGNQNRESAGVKQILFGPEVQQDIL